MLVYLAENFGAVFFLNLCQKKKCYFTKGWERLFKGSEWIFPSPPKICPHFFKIGINSIYFKTCICLHWLFHVNHHGFLPFHNFHVFSSNSDIAMAFRNIHQLWVDVFPVRKKVGFPASYGSINLAARWMVIKFGLIIPAALPVHHLPRSSLDLWRVGFFFWIRGNFYPLIAHIAIAGMCRFFFNRKYIFSQSGSIFQPAMLVYQRVNDKVAGGDFKYLLFSPLLGEDEPNLTYIFQRGWNHQLVNDKVADVADVSPIHRCSGHDPPLMVTDSGSNLQPWSFCISWNTTHTRMQSHHHHQDERLNMFWWTGILYLFFLPLASWVGW